MFKLIERNNNMSTLNGITDIEDFKENTERYRARQTIKNIKYLGISEDGDGYWRADNYEIWETIDRNQLSIRRLDRMPVESWYDMWNIKNLIWGEETLTVEIYPRKSELIDGCNHRHLFRLNINEKIDFSNASHLILKR